MGYTDDWESLMNGVFGPGGKLRYDVQKPPEKTGLPDLNAALLEQQKKLDEMLKKQNAALRGGTAQETLAQSRKMLEEMEADGLLAKGTAEVGQEHLGSFEGLAAEVKKTVLGQDAFVDGVVRAMRRPFVLGTEPPTARNVIRDGPLHGRAGASEERQAGRHGPCPLPRLRGRKALFAGPVRRPPRAGRDRGL